MYNWTENRYECIQYMIEYSDYHWAELNKLPDSLLSDMVRYNLCLSYSQYKGDNP